MPNSAMDLASPPLTLRVPTRPMPWSFGPSQPDVSCRSSEPICESRPCENRKGLSLGAHPLTNPPLQGTNTAEQLGGVYPRQPPWRLTPPDSSALRVPSSRPPCAFACAVLLLPVVSTFQSQLEI